MESFGRVPVAPTQSMRAGATVWSAALSQAKSEGGGLVCANVFGLYWSGLLQAMMECAALSSSLNSQSCEDFFAPQVWRAPGSTVEPSHCSPADLAGIVNSVAVAGVRMWESRCDFQAWLQPGVICRPVKLRPGWLVPEADMAPPL